MDISQYKDLIVGVDAILKVAFLDRTLSDLIIRIVMVLITVCVGYDIIIRII